MSAGLSAQVRVDALSEVGVCPVSASEDGDELPPLGGIESWPVCLDPLLGDPGRYPSRCDDLRRNGSASSFAGAPERPDDLVLYCALQRLNRMRHAEGSTFGAPHGLRS